MPDELRRHALNVLPAPPLFTVDKQLRATDFAHECEDIVRLTRWTASVQTEIARREAEAARQRCHRATHEMLRHLRATPFRGHCLRPLYFLSGWVPGAPLSDRADRRAGTFDRLAAACSQSVDSLTFASLLSRQSR